MQTVAGTHQLIEVFPIVLSHETERTQQRPTEVVEVRVAVVRVFTRPQTLAVFRTFTIQ